MRSTFMARGAGIAQDRDLHVINMLQIAPTLAGMLDVTLPEAKGQPLAVKPRALACADRTVPQGPESGTLAGLLTAYRGFSVWLEIPPTSQLLCPARDATPTGPHRC
jgi:hypothetical protein